MVRVYRCDVCPVLVFTPVALAEHAAAHRDPVRVRERERRLADARAAVERLMERRRQGNDEQG